MKKTSYILLAIALLAALVLFLAIPACHALRDRATPEAAEEIPTDETGADEIGADRNAGDDADKSSGELPDIDLPTPDESKSSGQGASSNQTGSQQSVSSGAGANQQGTPATHTHTVVKDPAVEATCQKTGLTEGSHCSVCGATITPQQVIPISEHNYVLGKCIWCGKEAPNGQDNGVIELPDIEVTNP